VIAVGLQIQRVAVGQNLVQAGDDVGALLRVKPVFRFAAIIISRVACPR
jgi:hypothetical protein